MEKEIKKDNKWLKGIHTCSAHSLGLLLIQNRKKSTNKCNNKQKVFKTNE